MKRALLVLCAVVDLGLRAPSYEKAAVFGAVYGRCRAEQEVAERFCRPCAEVAAREPGLSPVLDEDLTWWCFDTGVAGPPINPITGQPVW